MHHWRYLVRQPLARSLALSVGIHLALLAFVQPWTGAGAPRTLVINARLETTPEATPESPIPPVTAMEQPEELLPPVPQTKPPEPTPPPPDQLSVPKPAPIKAAEPPPAPVQAPPRTTETTAITSEASPPTASSEPLAVVSSPSSAATPAPPLAIPSPIDTNWYLARQVDRHPKAIGSITPKYPEEARQRGQEGTLKLMVKIDDLGRVRDVEVVEAQPPGIFDDAALEAFRNARFQPAMKEGRPVRYEAYMRVEFRLE